MTFSGLNNNAASVEGGCTPLCEGQDAQGKSHGRGVPEQGWEAAVRPGG